jgi:ABC-type uncharacterized transport system substrate-binding protein
MRISILFLLFMVAMLAQAHPANAHPHAWISVRTTIFVNEKGEATAIREHWLFDKMYSAYASRDYNPNKNGKFEAKDLLPLAKENISNLKDYNYFTVFENKDGKPIQFKDVKDIASEFEVSTQPAKNNAIIYAVPKGQKTFDDKTLAGAQQIAMDFTVMLATSVNLREHPAIYRIYDPTYYTDIGHYEKKPVTFVSEKDGKEIGACQAKVELPKVDQSMIFNATALDWNKNAPKDFGYYFSEKVTLSCSQPK